MKRLRILHCPQNIAGNPSKLAAGERAHGANSHLIFVERHPYVFPNAEDEYIPAGGIGPKAWVNRLRIWLRALAGKDIIHYNFGSTLTCNERPQALGDGLLRNVLKWIWNNLVMVLREAELGIFKLAGKKMYMTYQGSDGRDHAFHRRHFPITHCHVIADDKLEESKEKIKKRRMRQISRYMDGIFSVNPDLLHSLPKGARFVPYSNIWPEDFTFNPNPENPRKRIVHAPSKLDFKGTKHVVAAVERLKSEGHEFDFIMVHGVAWQEARKLYENADLLVDQLLAGWYGGVAVELMALGTPVMCYIRQDDLKFISPALRQQIPVINASPDDVYLRLKDFLSWDKQKYLAQRQKVRAYVDKWHDPRRIGAWMLARYSEEGTQAIPEFDPGSN